MDWIREILEGKQATCQQLRAFPFSEMVNLLKKVRDCSLDIVCSPLRQRHHKVLPPSGAGSSLISRS